MRHEQTRNASFGTNTHNTSYGATAAHTNAGSYNYGLTAQLGEAHAWGTLALDLVEKHYAHSRFADRGEVWEIFYCTPGLYTYFALINTT